VRGFGVRRQRQALKYILKTRIRGKDHWFTIGTHGAPWTVDSARREARRMLGVIAGGADLATDRERRKSTLTLSAVAERFLREHGKMLEERTLEEYERLLRKLAFPVFGDSLIDAIDRPAVAKLHHALADTPRQANHVLSVLSKVMSWAAKRGLLPSEANPCRGIDRYKENKRERFLSAAELSRLGETLQEAEEQQVLTPYAIAAIRFASDGCKEERDTKPSMGLRRPRQSAAPVTPLKNGSEVDLSPGSRRGYPAIVAALAGESLRYCR
jgi:Phage integrase central domain